MLIILLTRYWHYKRKNAVNSNKIGNLGWKMTEEILGSSLLFQCFCMSYGDRRLKPWSKELPVQCRKKTTTKLLHYGLSMIGEEYIIYQCFSNTKCKAWWKGIIIIFCNHIKGPPHIYIKRYLHSDSLLDWHIIKYACLGRMYKIHNIATVCEQSWKEFINYKSGDIHLIWNVL